MGVMGRGAFLDECGTLKSNPGQQPKVRGGLKEEREQEWFGIMREKISTTAKEREVPSSHGAYAHALGPLPCLSLLSTCPFMR